jgi:hypothetical protein
MNTTDFSFTTVFSASIIVITVDRSRNTTNSKITRIFIAFIVVVTSVRGISESASFLFIAVSIVTLIRRSTLRGDVLIDTTIYNTTGISSTSIVIITDNCFIFARTLGRSTFRITSINRTFIVVIAIYYGRNTTI